MREGNARLSALNSQGRYIRYIDRTTINLIGDYIEQLRTGKCPDPEDYAAQYKGQDRDTFKLQFYFCILLENDMRPIGEERLSRILPAERREEYDRLWAERKKSGRFYKSDFRNIHEIVMSLDLFKDVEDRIMAEFKKKSPDAMRRLLSDIYKG